MRFLCNECLSVPLLAQKSFYDVVNVKKPHHFTLCNYSLLTSGMRWIVNVLNTANKYRFLFRKCIDYFHQNIILYLQVVFSLK